MEAGDWRKLLPEWKREMKSPRVENDEQTEVSRVKSGDCSSGMDNGECLNPASPRTPNTV